MGAPKKLPELKRTLRVQVPVNREEKQMVRRLRSLRPAGVSDAEVIRDLVKRAYRREELKKTKAA
jgi:hypothetical protein